MKVKYVSIFTIVLVLLSGLPLIASPGAGMNYANAKYPLNTQTQANANDCNTGTNCAINSPQTQGDGTANSPTNLQISEFNEEQEDGVGGPTFPIASLDFMVIVECPPGMEQVCPREQDFRYTVNAFSTLGGPTSASPSEFSGSQNIDFFGGPHVGYFIFQTTPPTPHGLSLRMFAEGDCQMLESSTRTFFRGEIGDLERASCTITYQYDLAPYVVVKKEVICPSGFTCPLPERYRLEVVASGSDLISVNPETFLGSEIGTEVTIAFTGGVVSYRVIEVELPPDPSGLVLVQSATTDCRGEIDRVGETKTCTFTNEYRVAPTTP